MLKYTETPADYESILINIYSNFIYTENQKCTLQLDYFTWLNTKICFFRFKFENGEHGKGDVGDVSKNVYLI